MNQFLDRWKQKARALKIQIYALYLAYHHPRTPWYAKAFAALVVGYAFSPIDLIPDFVPVLGYLDDLILLPIGVKIAIRLIPADVMAESQEKAREQSRAGKPVNYLAAVMIVLIWVILFVLAAVWFGQRVGLISFRF
jgi:uncharacterized membrane protein YkvA (DUF1232 family)